MKHVTLKLAFAFALLALLVAPMGAQVATTQTTLSNTITQTQTLVQLASATGVVAPSFAAANVPTGNQTLIYMDREAMFVTGVNGTFISVIRGFANTRAEAHNSGVVVWVGPPFYFSDQVLDPVGACTATAISNLPRITLATGSIMDCVNSQFVNSSDGYFFVPAQGSCVEAASANAGTGDGTFIVDGSVPALKGILSASGAGSLVFTCDFTVPGERFRVGKGVVIQDLTYLYSPQTTAPTSMTASTFKSFTAPVPAASETTASATLVDQCNTCTQVPAIASGNFTAVAAGRYYSEKVVLGTPLNVTTPLQTFVFTFALAQSAASAMTVTSPGYWVHYSTAY
jgi:hypothetical protein